MEAELVWTSPLRWPTLLTLAFLSACGQSASEFLEEADQRKRCVELGGVVACSRWYTPDEERARAQILGYESWSDSSVRMSLWLEISPDSTAVLGAGSSLLPLQLLDDPAEVEVCDKKFQKCVPGLVSGTVPRGYRRHWMVLFPGLSWSDVRSTEWRLRIPDPSWGGGAVNLRLMHPQRRRQG